LKYGFVHKNSEYADPNYVPIGDSSVIASRDDRAIYKDYKIGDCIPFYFGPRSPMLYVIQHGYNNVVRYNAEDLVYAVIRLDDIVAHNIKCVFTDGHALDLLTTTYTSDKLSMIDDIISYSDVYATNWANSENDRDLKRRKEAELLLIDELPPQYIRGFAVYNEKAKQQILEYSIDAAKIAVRPNYYF
jgi:hypothetical protein